MVWTLSCTVITNALPVCGLFSGRRKTRRAFPLVGQEPHQAAVDKP
jgi:hypothetical protein